MRALSAISSGDRGGRVAFLPLGSPLRPLNQGQQREKAEACLLALDPETRASAVRDIEAQVQNLESLEDISTLIESLPQFTD